MTIEAKVTNILMAGVGGQGIILASEVLCEAALLAGFDVKKSEVHGMSQRGGSVNSHVRFGRKVHSPIIPAKEADCLVALEKLEALRWEHYLADDGIIVVNDFRLDPASVVAGKFNYADDAAEQLKDRYGERVAAADAAALALEAGDLRTMNTVILGVLSNFLPFNREVWQRALQEKVKKKTLEMNLRAFELGCGLVGKGNNKKKA